MAPAGATTSPFAPATAFAIDGDATGANDWDSPYGPYTTTAGHPSTGLYSVRTNPDPCNVTDDDIGGSGEKLSSGPVWDMLTGAVNPDKSDLGPVRLAAEKVSVDGTINDILYAAYERCNADGGSMIASLFFDDGDGLLPSQGDNGDYLMIFDFNPSKGSSATLLRWSGGGWNTPIPVDASKVDVASSQTFGEVAINLTALGVLPPDECRTVEAGGYAASASGYDPNSSLIDLVQVAPLRVTTCGALEVDKTANAPDDGTLFDYDVTRTGGAAVLDGGLDASGVHRDATPADQSETLAARLLVGEQDVWGDVVAGGGYTVGEDLAALPAGWSLDSIVCTYQDIFAAGYPVRTVTLVGDDAAAGSTFAVPPRVLAGTSLAPASCTLHNEFTGVMVVKAGDGDDAVDFDFTLDGDPFALALGESRTFPATAGEAVTVTEGDLPAAALPWGLDAIVCTDASGASVGQVDLANRTATVTPTAGALLTCTFTNNQRGELVVQKASDGGTGTFAITGTVAGDITTTADDGTVSGGPLSKVVAAGTGYSVAETPPDGWRLDSIVCDRGEDDPSDITVGAGETVTCTVTNTRLGSLTLTKEVTGVAADYGWSFTFTLSPAATGGGLQTASGTGSETSADVLAWTDLEPGTMYTVTESGHSGFDSAFVCTDASGAAVPDAAPATAAYDLTALPGMDLTCHVTNDAPPSSLELTKTVTGVAEGFAWAFDFTLSPAATGGGTQTASGTGSDTDALTWSDLVPGATYVLAEEVVPGYRQELTCTGVEDLDDAAPTVTFVAGLDLAIECEATNAALPSSLELTKTVTGVADGHDWSFGFTLSPAATGGGTQVATGTGATASSPLRWTALVPGATYVLTEAAAPGFDATLRCTGATDLDLSPLTVTFVAGVDRAIACQAVNAAAASTLALTKTVTGVADGVEWEFMFTIAPAAGGSAAQSIAGEGSGTSEAISWTGLTPGATYTVAEAEASAYDQEMVCTGVEDLDDVAHTVTFVAELGGAVTCEATNTLIPEDGVLEERLSDTGAEVRGLIALAIVLMGTGVALVVARRWRLG